MEAWTRDEGLGRFSAEPVVNLRPSGSGIDLQIRYVTPAFERFEMRNRHVSARGRSCCTNKAAAIKSKRYGPLKSNILFDTHRGLPVVWKQMQSLRHHGHHHHHGTTMPADCHGLR